jgi:hypothetical protein
MRKVIVSIMILLFLGITFDLPSFAKTKQSYKSSRSSYSKAKTVNVRSYKRKNGTVVKAYKRRPPNSKYTNIKQLKEKAE